jgi:hypothetical protein
MYIDTHLKHILPLREEKEEIYSNVFQEAMRKLMIITFANSLQAWKVVGRHLT